MRWRSFQRNAGPAACVLGLASIVGGCGFHPLYAPGSAAVTGLPEVYVDIIPERNGQILRQALQARLDGAAGDTSKHYELSVSYAYQSESLGIQSDNSSTRTRFNGTAHWTLHKPGPFGAKITTGVAIAMDGINNLNAQFFYGDLASEAVSRRMGDTLADQIAQSLAAYFRAHPDLA